MGNSRQARPVGARRRQRLLTLGGALALAAAVVAVIALAAGGDEGKPALRAGEALPGQVEADARFAGIPQDGIVLGNADAPVTLVEFADLQCPYCREYTERVMPALVAEYVRTGKVRMIFRSVTIIDESSHVAAEMAAAAGLQDKLWQYVDVFYANQGEERSGYVTDAFLEQIGGAVRGLDVARAMADRRLPQVQRQLTKAQVEMQTAGFQGTPSFLVGPTGGKLYAIQLSSLTADPFRTAIDAALRRSGT